MTTPDPRRPRGRPRNAFSDQSSGVIVALDRGLRVLDHLATHGGASLSDLAAATAIPVATMHRILTTLHQRGMVEPAEHSQKWFVGTQILRIGNACLNRTSLVEVARPIMAALTERTGETTNLAVENGGGIVFLSQVETDNPIRAFFRPGTHGFMHCSGIGKALMAHMGRTSVERIVRAKGLPKFTDTTITDADALGAQLALIRQRGWAYDDEERFLGMRCVAAAVFNVFGEPVGGVSLSGPTVRFPDDRIAEFGRLVHAAAQRISCVLQGHSPS